MRKNWYKPHLKIVYNVQDKTFVSRLNRLRFFHDRRVLKFLRWHKGDKGRKVRGIHSLKWYKMRYIFGLKFFNFSSKKRRKVRFYLQKNLYKVELYRKKGFLSFYRKLDDSKIRNWFKHQYNKSRQFKIINFFKMFETRLDVISFRMKLTPTIFLANMFIKTRGLQINYGLKKEPSYRLQIGDLISFESDTLWHFFASRFHNQLWKRWHRLIDLNKQRKTTRLLTFREYNKKSSLHIQEDRSLILNQNFKNLENTWTFFINQKQTRNNNNIKFNNFNDLQENLIIADKKTLNEFAINQLLVNFSLEKRSRLLMDYKLLLKEFAFSKHKVKLKKKKFFFFLVKHYIKNFFNTVQKEQDKLKHVIFFYKNYYKKNLKKNLLNNILGKNFTLFFFKEKNTLGLLKIFILNALTKFSLIKKTSFSFFLKKENSKNEQKLNSRINYYTSQIQNVNNFSSNLFFKRKNLNSLLENSFINLENFKWLDTWSQQILVFFNFNFQLKTLLQRIFVSFIIRNETYRFFFLKFWLIYRSFLTRFAKLFLPLKKFFQYLTLLKHICKSTNEKILSSSFYKGLYLRFFIQKFELISNFVSLIENQSFNFNQFFILLKNFLNPIIFMNNVNYLKKHFLLTRLPFETFTEKYNEDLHLVFEHVIEENFFDILADWVLYTNKHNIHFTIFWNHYCDEQKVVLIVYLKTALELKYDWKELFFKDPLKMDLTHLHILQPFCRGLHQEFYMESTFLLKDCFAMEQYSLLPKIKFTDFYLDNDLENKIMTSFLVAQQNAGLNEAEEPLTESEEEDEEELKQKKLEENNQLNEGESLQNSEDEYVVLNTSEEERLQRAFIYEEEEKDLGVFELSETSETEYEHSFIENELLNTSTYNWKKKQLFNINRTKLISLVTKNLIKSSLIERKLEKKYIENFEVSLFSKNFNYILNNSNETALIKNFDIKNNLKIFLKTIPFNTSFLAYTNSIKKKDFNGNINLRSKTYKKFILKEQKIWKRFRRLKRRRKFQFLRGHKRRRRYTFSRLLKKVKFVKNQKIQARKQLGVKKLTNFLLKRNFIRNLASFKLNSWRRKRGKNFFNLVNFNKNIQKNLYLPIRRIYFKKRYLVSKKTKRKKKFLVRSINFKTNSFWRNIIKLILLNNNKKHIKSQLTKNVFFIKQSFIILRALQNLKKKNSSFNFKFQRTLNKKRTKKRLYFFLSTPRFRKQILKQYRKDKKFMKSHKSSTIIMNKKKFFSRWKWKTHYKQPRNWIYLNNTLRNRNKKLFFTSKVKQNMLAQFNSLSKNKSIKDKKKIKFSSFSFWRKKKKKKAKAWVSNRKSNRRSSNLYLRTVKRRFRFLPTQFSFYKFNFFKRKKSYKRFRGVKQWWRRTIRPKKKEYRVASLKRYHQKSFKNVVAFSLDTDTKQTNLINTLWTSQQNLALKLKFLNNLKIETQLDSSFLLYQQFYNLQAFIPNYGWNFDQKVNEVQELENENWFTNQENNTRNEIFYTMYKKNKVLKSFDKLLLNKSVKMKPRRKHSLMMRSNFFKLKKKVNNFKNLQKNLSFNITEDKLRRYKKYIWYHQKWMRRSSVRKRYKFRTKLLQLNKIRRLKKKKFLNIKTKPSLFLPHFLEYDFVTFRGVMISFPKVEASVFGGASNSYFYGLINYYQRLGL